PRGAGRGAALRRARRRRARGTPRAAGEAAALGTRVGHAPEAARRARSRPVTALAHPAAGAQCPRSLPAPLAQQPARGRAGSLAVLEGDLAVHENRLVALRLLHPPPLPAGEVVDDLAVPV